jgi:tRNA U34 5-carboxymethylaminomethyl modifying GTPase MnmE/TrmE
MKFLKNYKLFLEQDETTDDIQGDNQEINDENEKVNKESLELIKSQLQEYRDKISDIDDIFSKKDLNDSIFNFNLFYSIYCRFS